jgi:FAD/FMN-containing dehydrogenase
VTAPFTPREFLSWGRVLRAGHEIATPSFRDELPGLITRADPGSLLPVGLGRSYGDSGLNPDGRLIDMTRLDRLISLDATAGKVRAEAGLSLGRLLGTVVPQGWFTATTPGTRFVTLGGMIANDVHGKNHHRAGSLGCSVTGMDLLRSDGHLRTLSPSRDSELFAATIGGLGLTGVMTTVDLDLVPIRSAYLDVERIAFGHVRDYFKLAAESADNHEHTVSWIDCSSGGASLGRGIFQRARWLEDGDLTPHASRGALSMPIDAPGFTLNGLSVRMFNSLYFQLQKSGADHTRMHYGSFFYPLDAIGQWNRLYGRRGFYQYQCVIPPVAAGMAVEELLRQIAKSGASSFLSVLKTLGPKPSPGLLSFPREGATLALDFANKGPSTLALLARLDDIVREAQGRLYPAKDGRIPAVMFRASYPHWQRFAAQVDPGFSSSFWRRVAA